MKKIFIIIILVLAQSGLLMAQSGGFSGSHTRMGFTPRGMAMGNALSTVSDDGIYPYHNPALAADVRNTQIDISSALMSFNRNLNTLGVAFRLPPSAGLYVGIINANVSNIDGRTSSGYHTSMLSTHDYQVFTSFGLQPGPKVRLGATVKLNMADYHDDVSASRAFGMDLGLIITPSEKLRIGLTAQDLFSETIWNTADLYGAAGSTNTSNSWPTRITLGSSYRPSALLLLSAEIEQRVQQSVINSKTIDLGFGYPTTFVREDDITTSTRLVRIGSRYHIHERLTLRAGYQNGDLSNFGDNQRLSAGFSIHLPLDTFSPSIDYAITREPMGISFMHAFSIRLNL
jgi:hypothetical protein